MSFTERVRYLPTLGLGVAAELGGACAEGSLDPMELHFAHPELCAFLQIGLSAEAGLHRCILGWSQASLPATVRLEDVNLDDPDDLNSEWLSDIQAAVAFLKAAWVVCPAGWQHLGARDRCHVAPMPAVLTDDTARAMAEGLAQLRDAVGHEVLPQNPSGTAFPGNLHVLEFMSRLAEYADTGLALDLSHLVATQALTGRQPTDGIADLDRARVAELHLAGATERIAGDLRWVQDKHAETILPTTWALLEGLAGTLPNLKATVLDGRAPHTEGGRLDFERALTTLGLHR